MGEKGQQVPCQILKVLRRLNLIKYLFWKLGRLDTFLKRRVGPEQFQFEEDCFGEVKKILVNYNFRLYF